MVMTAYMAPPPENMGDYLAGRETIENDPINTEDDYERFHRAHLIDARLEDCGQPEHPEFHREALFERQPQSTHDHDPRFHRKRRFAYCPDGHKLKLDRLNTKKTQGYHFRHWPSAAGERKCRFEPVASESAEHKAIKKAVVDAFRTSGAQATPERKTASLRSQPDVEVITPDGRKYAIEIQVSDIGGAGVAARRNRYLIEDGYRPIWVTTLPQCDWQERVPCLRLSQPFEDLGDPTYYVTVRRIAYERCRSHCWYRRWSGEKACPGHYAGATVLNQEDIEQGRERKKPRIDLDEFAAMIGSGELVEARYPRPSINENGIPLVTFTEDAEIAAQHFVEYSRWRTSALRKLEKPRERLPECTANTPPRNPEDRDYHGEYDARIDHDREFVRRLDRFPVAGEVVTLLLDGQLIPSAGVRSVSHDDYGRPLFEVRYWQTGESHLGVRRHERIETTVTADEIVSIDRVLGSAA